MEHTFTLTLLQILRDEFGEAAEEIFRVSELLQYINRKTKSASSGSKSRGAFANHYAIYVLVEDYIQNGYHQSGGYKNYAGAQFSQLFSRQRKLPFGAKLQNHALNSRLNEEFKKFFPETSYTPIIRNLASNKYWINENLLVITIGEKSFNVAEATLKIIDAYVAAKKDAFENFIKDCVKIQHLQEEGPAAYTAFIESLLRPNVDARIFEIVSYAILKEFYKEQQIFWGWSLDNIAPENLKLYKTGRTNANDGGIDFIMRPLGRFFQVTETLDVKKYFLDIDKIQHFPLTFVVKSELSENEVLVAIQKQAQEHFVVNALVETYMQAIEEIIPLPRLMEMLKVVIELDSINAVFAEIVLQSKLEFNYVDAQSVEAQLTDQQTDT